MVHLKGFRSPASRRSHPTNLDSSTTPGRPSQDILVPLLPTEMRHSPTLGEAALRQKKMFGCVPLEVILSGNSRVADAIDSFVARSQRVLRGTMKTAMVILLERVGRVWRLLSRRKARRLPKPPLVIWVTVVTWQEVE
ncbi:hypothetical protein CPC08DRAFT_714429 [Agrocybe pediades]|nr:hypothetical protein CPC08DRAFT_714429 [Agrocybe pediades]